MRVERIDGKTGVVGSGSLRHEIDLSLLKDIKVGEYVIVHAGFAIEKVDEDRAAKTLEIIEEMARSI